MIQISHLTKKYGDYAAVDDLTLDLAPGKIYGFLGPNGAGKSTTMNMITGYLAATEGTVTINGFDIVKQPQRAKKCIGYLPEQPPLYMDMTVGEYLKFAADIKKLPKEKKRQYVEEAMELTKTADMKNRLIRNLSKGYRQRVGFAQAVLGYPQVIILDEPTVGLDPKQMIEFRERMRSFGKKHTVILSSHILSEVREVCEHIFIISKGRLVASDTTENLVARSGGQEIRLLLKGSPQAVGQTLKEAGLKEDQPAADADDGCSRVVLKAGNGEDIREKVFYTFAKADIPILEMTVGSKSLEQVFLELTEKGAQPELFPNDGKIQDQMAKPANEPETSEPAYGAEEPETSRSEKAIREAGCSQAEQEAEESAAGHPENGAERTKASRTENKAEESKAEENKAEENKAEESEESSLRRKAAGTNRSKQEVDV